MQKGSWAQKGIWRWQRRCCAFLRGKPLTMQTYELEGSLYLLFLYMFLYFHGVDVSVALHFTPIIYNRELEVYGR